MEFGFGEVLECELLDMGGDKTEDRKRSEVSVKSSTTILFSLEAVSVWGIFYREVDGFVAFVLTTNQLRIISYSDTYIYKYTIRFCNHFRTHGTHW